MTDFLATLLTIGWVGIFLVFSEGLAKLDKISKENARKIIHIGVGNVIFFIPLFETRWLAAGIPAIFVIGNYLLSPMSPIQKMRLKTFEAGHAWGTILYPISLSISVYVFFDQPWLIIASFFPVVYGDGFAAVFGPKAKQGIFKINGTTKSLIGTSVVASFSLVSVSIGAWMIGTGINYGIILGIFVAMISPFVELMSPKGTDNFVLPVVLAVILLLSNPQLVIISTSFDLVLFMYGIIFGLIFAVGGYFFKVLTIDGAITGFIITLLMLGIGGITIGSQLFLFFILGSGATKIVKNIAGKTQEEFEKGGEKRDAIQAIAKAGIPAVLSFLLLLLNETSLFYVITGIMAAALIDTMATEVGIATKGIPVHILTPWKRATTGQTGVISAKGTLGGMGFGLIFAFTVYLFSLIDPNIALDYNLIEFVSLVILAGTGGMLSDSLIGTTLQRHNKCQVCDKIVEADQHHETETLHYKGIKWMNNDITNILGTSIGGIIMFLLISVV